MRIVSQNEFDRSYKNAYTKPVAPRTVNGVELKAFAKEYKGLSWTLALFKLLAEMIPTFGLAYIAKSVREDFKAVFKGRKIVAIESPIPSFKALKDGEKTLSKAKGVSTRGVSTAVENVLHDRDKKNSMQFLQSAAESGNGEAACWLGRIYLFAIGGEKDNKEAMRWFKFAADRNYPDGLFHYGECLLLGWGVAKDPVKANEYLHKAADLGQTTAKDYLSRIGS